LHDYGLKRTGLAVTDPMQIIASGLTTVESPKLTLEGLF
jgi:putative Holliday junction resolvase